MLGRIRELWNAGGVVEVFRGVRDFLGLDTVHTHLIDKKVFRVGEIDVTFVVRETEDLKRSRGHGELAVLEDFLSEVRSEDVVWDVGANIGTYSLFAAKKGATAIAFEPASDALLRLYQNIDLNSVDISVREIALANESGEKTLVDAEKSGHKKLAEGGGETIDVRRGDDIEEESPDIIKIDVEGAEYEVVQGMQNTLADARICYIEFHDGVDKTELIELLQTKGLSIAHEFSGDITRDLDLVKFTR